MSGDSQPMMSFQYNEPEELESDAQKKPSSYPAQETPPVLTDPPEQKEIQLAVAEEEIIQITLSLSDNEMQTFPNVSEEYPPEASSRTEPEPKPDVKQEYEDVAVTTEEDKWEIIRLEETQACHTSGEKAGAQLKPEENELHQPEESFQPCPHRTPSSSGGYFSSVRSQITQSCLINTTSPEMLGPLQNQEDLDPPDAPLRPCSVRLQRPEILQRAISQFHVCSFCDKIFKYRRTLRRHRRFHTGERPHGCSLCSRAFILRRTLRQHMKAHFRRPYSCTQCGKRFRHWRKLRLHWRSHAGESPFICSRCGKRCRTLKSLDRHLAYVDHDCESKRSLPET